MMNFTSAKPHVYIEQNGNSCGPHSFAIFLAEVGLIEKNNSEVSKMSSDIYSKVKFGENNFRQPEDFSHPLKMLDEILKLLEDKKFVNGRNFKVIFYINESNCYIKDLHSLFKQDPLYNSMRSIIQADSLSRGFQKGDYALVLGDYKSGSVTGLHWNLLYSNEIGRLTRWEPQDGRGYSGGNNVQYLLSAQVTSELKFLDTGILLREITRE